MTVSVFDWRQTEIHLVVPMLPSTYGEEAAIQILLSLSILFPPGIFTCPGRLPLDVGRPHSLPI